MICESCGKHEFDLDRMREAFKQAEDQMLGQGWTAEILAKYRENYRFDDMKVCPQCAEHRYYTFYLLCEPTPEEAVKLAAMIRNRAILDTVKTTHQHILKMLADEYTELFTKGITHKQALLAERLIKVIATLGKQSRHIDEDEAKEIHIYRRHLDMSVRDIAFIFKRSSETIHRVLKRPVSLPPKSLVVEQR